MNRRWALLTAAAVSLGMVLLPACQKPAGTDAPTPAQQADRAPQPPAPKEDAPQAASTGGGAYTVGVVLGQGTVAKSVEAGMRQVAPANGTELKVASDAKALLDQKVNALILVGPSGSQADAAQAAKVPVVIVGGEAKGKPAAELATGTALDTLREPQAKELGRVAVETTFSLLKGDKDIETKRSMQSIL